MKASLHYRLIKKNIFSEKASLLAQDNQYIFEVSASADKQQIKNAVEYVFNVKVERVNVLNCKGEFTFLKRVKGKKSDTKKAYIKLKEGYSINIGNG